MSLPDQFFQSLYDASPNPYLILDRDLHIASANRAYLTSTGRELADIVGRWAWDAFPTDPATLEQAIASFHRVIRTGKVDTMALLRFDIPRADSEGGGFEVRYWSITHSPVFGRNGEVEYVLQHPIDVTELERLREAERHSHEAPLALVPAHSGIFRRAQDVYEANLTLLNDVNRLESLFQRAPSFMSVLRGPDHVFELVNQATIDLMGARDYIGRPIREVMPDIQEQGFLDLLDQAYRSGKPVVVYGRPARFQREAGVAADRVLNFVYQPILDSHGAVEGIFVEGNDVTEQYTAQRLREEQMTKEARHKDEFLAMLAHELRNPLAPISSAADVLGLVHLDPARTAMASAIIRRQVAHMSSLINDLLDVSRVTNGLVSLDIEPVLVEEVVQEALEQVLPIINSREHRIEVDLPREQLLVAGDRKRLVQVLANLLNNAAKYTGEGGAIALRVTVNAAQVVVKISDNGIGMTPEVQKSAFGLFTQAERTPDRAQGGLGIGLALVKSIVELHHGSVSAYSPGLGQGSTVTVVLPRSAQQHDAPATQATPAARGPALDIMIVDDNVDAAQLLSIYLAEQGHAVVVEHGSAAALERAAAFAPDVCLLDIGMPNVDGNRLARQLRALPAARDALLIAVSGYGTQQDIHAAMHAGFDHYLIKPVNIMTLMQLLPDEKPNQGRRR